ncbi:hypothetical protein BDN72DRAFT_757375 [Pluteus cervinus]|uniref:Uncharacterized protein n=1 Tax=Pluteus cervinus TaxID=181527 RepID=A0ACD3BBE4_9AGAR|nr:hypothetical protein BDN72DRAFT_757375 [Pluteus cervinus]
MISHNTLYGLANALGILAMFTVIGYHFVAVNAKYLGEEKRVNQVCRALLGRAER